MQFNYYYGGQAEMFSFFRVPRILFTAPEFKGLSNDAKLLYGLMLDRMSLSAANGWFDSKGRVYIYFTMNEVQEVLNCGHDKAIRLLAELDTKKGIGLIERVKQGQGRPTIIYVKQFADAKLPDLPKQSLQNPVYPRSAKTENIFADFEKPETNYTNINYTDYSYTDPSIVKSPLNSAPRCEHQGAKIQEPFSSQTQTQPTSALGFEFETKEEIKERIEYDIIKEQYPNDDVESLVELMAEVQLYNAPTIRIGRQDIPSSFVKRRFRQLEREHIEFVLDSLRENTNQIKNIKAYLLTALYNAPITIGPYYSAMVRSTAS